MDIAAIHYVFTIFNGSQGLILALLFLYSYATDFKRRFWGTSRITTTTNLPNDTITGTNGTPQDELGASPPASSSSIDSHLPSSTNHEAPQLPNPTDDIQLAPRRHRVHREHQWEPGHGYNSSSSSSSKSEDEPNIFLVGDNSIVGRNAPGVEPREFHQQHPDAHVLRPLRAESHNDHHARVHPNPTPTGYPSAGIIVMPNRRMYLPRSPDIVQGPQLTGYQRITPTYR